MTWNTQKLENLIVPMQEKLAIAERLVSEEDNWEEAIVLTNEVYNSWVENKDYLHISLAHSQVDRVHSTMRESLAFLEHKEIGEYYASNQRLIIDLGLIFEMEQLSIDNIL